MATKKKKKKKKMKSRATEIYCVAFQPPDSYCQGVLSCYTDKARAEANVKSKTASDDYVVIRRRLHSRTEYV
jgi:hypothetical protein